LQPVLDPDSDSETRIGGGWFGGLGYALAGLAEPTVPGPPRHLLLPRAPLGFHDWVGLCDADGAWWFESLETPERASELARRREQLAATLAAGPRPGPVRFGPATSRGAGEVAHASAIESCRERIRGGELFQANLCQHLDLRLDAGRPADLAATVADRLAPAYGAYLHGGWGSAVSASPELFLRRVGRWVRTEPVKGTAPRGGDGALAASEKDRAENVMIVDLMRNDLGRVCETGSITVGALAAPRPGAGVVHLVSDISGTLREHVGDADLLRASFPPGSVTGAPKVQAMRMIAELEGSARELYTGAIGYASPVAGLELSVAIRTFELRGERMQLGVGGGITAASDAQDELEECRVKARPLLALGGSRFPAPASAGRGLPTAHGLTMALGDGRRRPDPRRGVFETIRVTDGVPLRLEAHLERLAHGARLVPVAVPVDIRSRIKARARTLEDGRLRVEVNHDGVTVTDGPMPAVGPPVVLAPCLLPGGLGPAKWADRELVDALSRALGATPLFVDADGALLEAGWATVWIEEGGVLVTPPLDGRILPGVARAALLAGDPRCREGAVSLTRARAADAVWISTALRGLAPATLQR
ncbi:MAG: chorismate-binding protein, partial [Solirubrobacterales bacterium]|nr:chorismate-binding protein [Solirubrobacterales bacterium]